MAIIKRMSSKASVGKVEKYLKQEEKTEERLISGMNCDSENFARECQATNLLYNKNQHKEDRKYYHVVQSFSPKDSDNLSPEKAHKIAMEFAEKNFKGHEVLVVTHRDKDHVHNHFIVNSVSLENGKKYRADNKSLWQMREQSNDLCKKNGLTHSIQDLKKKSKDKMKSGELRKALRGEDVWKTDLKAKIEATAQKATSPEQFKKEMSEKFKVEVQERTRKSKGKSETVYEYKPEGNRKFCPENRLGLDYGKENIDGIIRRNAEKERSENTRDSRTDSRPAGSGGAVAGNIETELRNRQAESVELDLKQREQELARIEETNRGTQEPKSKVNEKVRGIRERER